MPIKGLHHVSITVKDFDASIKLYTQGFGFKEDAAWTMENNQRAMMLDMGNGAFLEVFSGSSDDTRPAGIFDHIALASDNCDEDLQKAIAAGATIEMEPRSIMMPSDPPASIRIAFCRGLDGELIEFFQNL